jgi:hypothetical protein
MVPPPINNLLYQTLSQTFSVVGARASNERQSEDEVLPAPATKSDNAVLLRNHHHAPPAKDCIKERIEEI